MLTFTVIPLPPRRVLGLLDLVKHGNNSAHPLCLSRRHFGAADLLGAFLLFVYLANPKGLFLFLYFSLARFLDGVVLCISSAHVVMEGAVSWWLTVYVNGCNS